MARGKILKRALKLYTTYIIAALLISTVPLTSAGVGDFIAVIDNFDTIKTSGDLATAVRLNDSQYFAFIYQGASTDGYIDTIKVNTSATGVSGTFTGVRIDREEYDTTNGIGPGICHIGGTDYYLLGYNEGGAGGLSRFSTIRILENGSIGSYLINNASINVSCLYFNITHLDGPFYVAVSQDYGADPDPIYLHTIHVNTTNGTIYINDTQVITAEGTYARIEKVDRDTVAVVYKATGGFLNVTTWSVNPSNGDLSGKLTDGQNHNGIGATGKCDLERVESTSYYLASYSFESAGSYYVGVGEVTITAAGAITTDASYGSSHEYTRAYAAGPYPRLVDIQPGYIYGISTGQHLFLFNISASTITLHGSDNGYIIWTTFSGYYANTVHFERNTFVGGFTETVTNDGMFRSYSVQNNWASPTIIPYPANGSLIGTTSTHLAVAINDGDGDSMNVKWYSNMSGAWKYYGANNSVANGTYRWYNADFQSLNWDTTYYWRVDVLDWNSIHNTSSLFKFTPTNFSSGNATNASIGLDLVPNLSVNISGAVDNVTWYWWNNSAWEWFGNNETNFIAGNYSMEFHNASKCCELYQWAVTTSNSITGESDFEWYWFTTLCPNPPTAFNAARYNSTAINLTWTEWSHTNASGTIRTMIRYSNTTYPSTPTSGILLYNGTHDEYNHTGLTPGQTYYYSAFTIYQKNNSWCTSTSYSTDSLTAAGGRYNITVRWEGDGQLMIPASAFWKALKITFARQNGSIIHQEQLEDFATNPFVVDVNETADIIYITYDDWGVIRSLCPEETERATTFWFSNRTYWNGSSIAAINGTQVYYKFSYNDLTFNSIFITSDDTKVKIYRWHNSTTRMRIHEMFLDASDQTWAMLEYGERYSFGIECDDDERFWFASFLADTDQTPDAFIILPQNDTAVFLDTYIRVNTTQLANGMWVNYTDTSFNTTTAILKIYKYHSNGTIYLMESKTFNTPSFIYYWQHPVNYVADQEYMIEINITNGLFTTTLNFIQYTFPYYTGQYDAGWFNNMCIKYIGQSPLTNDAGASVPYSAIVSFIVAFTVLVSFGSYFGSTGLMASGFALFIMEVLLWDASVYRFSAGVVAVAMICIGVLFNYGGRK